MWQFVVVLFYTQSRDCKYQDGLINEVSEEGRR